MNQPPFSTSVSESKRSALIVPVWILAVLGLGALLREASIIFLWITCSFLLFALVDPWMQRLNRRGIAPVLSALVLVSLASAVAAGLGLLLYNSFPSFVKEFDAYRNTVLHLYENGSKTLAQWGRSLTHAAGTSTATTVTTTTTSISQSPNAGSPLQEFGSTIFHGLGSVVTALTFAVLCPILTFFLIAERNTFARVFDKGFFAPQQGQLIWSKITESTGAFFLGNFILLGISFPVFWLIFSLFGVSSALPMAALASVFNLVPFVGAVLSGALPSLSMLANNGPIGSTLGLFASCVLVHFFVANLITPKILGSKMNLNATVSTIALIAWGEMWGGMGLLLAIPMTSVIKILFQYSGNERLHWIAMLMSDNPDTFLKQGYRRFRTTGRGLKATPTLGTDRHVVLPSVAARLDQSEPTH